jgi:hypothetical protein
MPVVELTRNSKREGENGPPRGPEKAMLLAGVTINDGGDSQAGLVQRQSESTSASLTWQARRLRLSGL